MKKQMSQNDMEFKIMMDCWKLYQKYYIPEVKESYWDDLIDEVHEIDRKYNSELCRKILLAYVDDIERRYQEEKHDRNGTAGVKGAVRRLNTRADEDSVDIRI